jgi:hypothetical protein
MDDLLEDLVVDRLAGEQQRRGELADGGVERLALQQRGRADIQQ